MLNKKQKGGPLGIVMMTCHPHTGPWRKDSNNIEVWATATGGDLYCSRRLVVIPGIKEYKVVLLELKPHNFHLIKKIKERLPHIFLIGTIEGSSHGPEDYYDFKVREGFLKAYRDVDAIGTLIQEHNSYFQAQTDKPVFWMGVPFPVEWAQKYIIEPEKKEPLIEIQTAAWDRKGGLANLFTLRNILKDTPEARGQSFTSNVQAERKIATQYGIHIKYIKHNNDWQPYFINHTKAYIGIHLDFRWTWNRYALDCAGAGIPCITTPHSSTSRILFPKLLVDPFDIDRAKDLALRLLRDKAFYAECRDYAFEKLRLFNYENSRLRLEDFIKKHNPNK